jgi:peptidoglycan/xylan/chitin deacetylase (PgdA/CDA1 family)
MYHYVRDVEKTDYPGIKALPVDDFIKQLDWCVENYKMPSYAEFESTFLSGTGFDEPTGLLTFDDGFIDNYETVFPILIDKGLSGVFFACDSVFIGKPDLLNVHKVHFILSTINEEQFEEELKEELSSRENIEFDIREREGLYINDLHGIAAIKRLLNYELPYEVVDEVINNLFEKHIGDAEKFAKNLYLSQEQIIEMHEAGMFFGTHTKNHRVLSRLDEDEQREELCDGANIVRSITGQNSVPFCYPYGLNHTYDEHALNLLREYGYKTAFTVGRTYTSFKEDPLEIPRFDTNEFPPRSDSAPISVS